MLSLSMHLSSEALKGDRFESEATPMAIADFTVVENQTCALITLKGVIDQDGALMMSKFFEDILALPAQVWRLQLKDLRRISTKGLSQLARFDRHLRRRGFTVEVIGIEEEMYYYLLDASAFLV